MDFGVQMKKLLPWHVPNYTVWVFLVQVYAFIVHQPLCMHTNIYVCVCETESSDGVCHCACISDKIP